MSSQFDFVECRMVEFAMAVTYDTNINTALTRSLPRVKINLSNWGNTGSTADAESTMTQLQPYSLHGLAIDPESEVRSVYIQSDKTWGSPQLVTPNSPFTGEIPGPWRAVSDAAGNFGDFYYPSGTNTLTPFGPNMGNDGAGTSIFGGGSIGFPNLVLIGYLRPIEILPVSSNRLFDQSGLIPISGGETLRVYAIPYRTTGRVFAKSGPDTTGVDLRVTTAPGGTAGNIREDTSIGSTVTIAGPNQEGSILLSNLVNARWLFIKVGDTVTGLAPTISIRVEIE